MTYTHPVAGYMFPTWEADPSRFDVNEICSQLAALEAEPLTDLYDETWDALYEMSADELEQVYQEKFGHAPIDY